MSKKLWLQRHLNDPFVKQAQKAGYVSRAAYKLLELQRHAHIFKPGMLVIDLGAAPGGWTQVATSFVKPTGHVIALDLLPLVVSDELVTVVSGDFNEEVVLTQLDEAIKTHRASGQVDVIMSDMAPNLSGNKVTDQARVMQLVELAWDCAERYLKPGGTWLVKIFQGSGVDQFIQNLRPRFNSVKRYKPEASRASSAEFYVLAQNYSRLT